MCTVSSIKEICKQFITPALQQSGWNRELQISFCEDSGFSYRSLHTEYVLYYTTDIPIAVISVTGYDTEIDTGINKAISNAEYLDIPCAFCSNGSCFVFYNRTKSPQYAKTILSMNDFPRPEDLWAIYLSYKSAQVITAEIGNAISNGMNRLLVGCVTFSVGILSLIGNVIRNLFETGDNKRVLCLTDNNNYADWDYLFDKNKQALQSDEYQQKNNGLQKYSSIYNNIWFYPISLNELSKSEDYTTYPSGYFDIIFLDVNNSKECIAEAKYQNILEYFASTPQIAIRSKDLISKYDVEYFGNPLYVGLSKYSIKSDTLPYEMQEPITSIAEKPQYDNGIRAYENEIEQFDNIMKNAADQYNENKRCQLMFETNNLENSQVAKNIFTSSQPIWHEDKLIQYNNNTTIRKSTINTNITINTTIMARQTSFAYQLELAEDLKAYLLRLQENLAAAAQKYTAKSNSLYEAGMMDEKHKILEEYMFETVNRIKGIVEQINEADIPFVERYIAYLEESLSIK